jgi:hypothetical protein
MHELKKTDYAARIRFSNWLLQNVHDGIEDPQLLFMTDDAWFHISGHVKMSHRNFRLSLVRNVLEHAPMCRPRLQRSLGRPPALSSRIYRLEEANRQHWPTHSDKRMNCRVCSTRGKRRSIRTKCEKCDVGLCILGCFKKYHTKGRFN